MGIVAAPHQHVHADLVPGLDLVGMGAVVMPGNGDGSFDLGLPTLETPVLDQIAAELADVTGDGRLDLVVADRESSELYVRAGLGGGAFAPEVRTHA